MRRFRFTIGSLLVLVLFLGVAFAALKEANEIWDGSILTLTFAALLVSILLAVHRVERKRAFWLGFALFGSTYLGLTLVPSVESRILTTRGLSYLDSKVPGRPEIIIFQTWGSSSNNTNVNVQGIDYEPGSPVSASGSPGIKLWSAATGKSIGGWGGTTESFIRIGHSLIALIAAWLGGLLSRGLYASPARRTQDGQPRSTDQSPR